MNILHLSASPLAGAPIKLASFLNKYTQTHNRSAISLPTSIDFGHDILVASTRQKGREPIFHENEELIEEAKKADIIHIHNYPPLMPSSPVWDIIRKKKIVAQFHSPPKISNSKYNALTLKLKIDKILVIAQYHAHVLNFPNQIIVRNAIDIYDPILSPIIIKNNPPIITFSPSNVSKEREWHYKSIEEINNLFRQIQEDFKCLFITNTPWQKCMKKRQIANIHIDEIHSGSYHLSSLEGLSQGKVVIANIAEWMEAIIKDVTGCDKIPWLICNESNIKKNIYRITLNQDKLLEIQRESRRWMEDYWNPQLIADDYLRVYNSL